MEAPALCAQLEACETTLSGIVTTLGALPEIAPLSRTELENAKENAAARFNLLSDLIDECEALTGALDAVREELGGVKFPADYESHD